jgi:hypothetical protein
VLDDEQWHRALDQNLFPAVRLDRALLPGVVGASMSPGTSGEISRPPASLYSKTLMPARAKSPRIGLG